MLGIAPTNNRWRLADLSELGDCWSLRPLLSHRGSLASNNVVGARDVRVSSVVSDKGMPADQLPRPGPNDRGLAVAGARVIAQETVEAWTAFLAVAGSVDIDAPARVKKTSTRAVITKVGSWPESRQLPEILADARAGSTTLIDQDKIDDRTVAANSHRPKDELIAAVARSRDSLVDWLAGTTPDLPRFEEFALRSAASPLGPLPLITYLHAGAFQLAISARDIEPDFDRIPDSLLTAGLRALVDTTGALASRMEISSDFAVVTPSTSVFTATSQQSWITQNVEASLGREVAGVEGNIGVVLDVGAGRINPLRGIGGRQVSIRNLPALLRLAPIANANPGLPGGPLLRKTASWLAFTNNNSKGSR